MAAIRALEARSLEFMREKQQKKKLESRIATLQSQMLGGMGLTNTPAFRNALKEHRDRIRMEYETKMGDLERERETIEEEKAQVRKRQRVLHVVYVSLTECGDSHVIYTRAHWQYDTLHLFTYTVIVIVNTMIVIVNTMIVIVYTMILFTSSPITPGRGT